MRNSIEQNLPLSRKDDLLIQKILDEIVIYDKKSERMHCLNVSSAAIWELCDGKTPVSEIALKLSRKLDFSCDEEIVMQALQDFESLELLEKDFSLPAAQKLSRRNLVKEAAKVAVLLPLVTTITAPASVMAQSPGIGGTQGEVGAQGPQGLQGFQGPQGAGFP